jgi:hypothetical protein
MCHAFMNEGMSTLWPQAGQGPCVAAACHMHCDSHAQSVCELVTVSITQRSYPPNTTPKDLERPAHTLHSRPLATSSSTLPSPTGVCCKSSLMRPSVAW